VKAFQSFLLAGAIMIAIGAEASLGLPGSALAAVSNAQGVSTKYAIAGQLVGVADISPTNAWAVGYAQASSDELPRTLLLHWNGKHWSRVSVPSVTYGWMTAIDAVSPDNVWVIGNGSPNSNGLKFFVLHWNGRTWHQSTTPVQYATANAIAATRNEVWISDYTYSGGGETTAFLHLSRGHWYVVPIAESPSYQAVRANGIAILSPTSAWAGGWATSTPSSAGNAILLHWNGSTWKQVKSPITSAGSWIYAMARGPDDSVLEVGYVEVNQLPLGVSVRWDGRGWQEQPQNPKLGMLLGVSSIPGGTAWTVGWSRSGLEQTARWTGSHWTVVPSPVSFYQALLNAVSASSTHSAWAVGLLYQTPHDQATRLATTLILHWNGKTWS
jgi:hypothetical protein